ncbi:MAG: hypothetical protein EXR72_02030 [Myxococcales bacterium]|nr:hypothetical protein [Myxococcales bacterium]
MRLLGLAVATAAGLAAACGQGTVYFTLEAPSEQSLSPLADPRADSIVLTDERTLVQLGPPVSAKGEAGVETAIGPIRVGTYDVRMSVRGGGLLLGLARTRDVTITSGILNEVTLHLRKPLAFYGAGRAIAPAGMQALPAAAQLMALDTTLPALTEFPAMAELGDPGPARATASTHDGRFLLVGTKSDIDVVDTLTIRRSGRVTLPGATAIRSIAVAPDDHAAAVVTDQGVVVIADLPSLLAGRSPGELLLVLKDPAARVAAFHPDSSQIAVIAGPPWENAADNCAKAPPATLYTFPVDGVAPAARMAPPGTTDVAYDAQGNVLMASPCNAPGVIFENGARPPVGGPGVYDIISVGDRIAGVLGTIREQPVPIDPDSPRTKDPTRPFGELFVATATGVSRVALPLPKQPLDFVGADGFPVAIPPLSPDRFDAYDVALSPDGTHLLIASRLRYSYVTKTGMPQRYFELKQSNITDYYCDLEFIENVYRLFEVDISSGALGYQAIKGIEDGKCSTQCYDCTFGCRPVGSATRSDCRLSSGFAPSGISILMGSS